MTHDVIVSLAFYLVAGHFVADYGLQSQYIADFKNPFKEGNKFWYWPMIAHCFIHGFMVMVVLHSVYLALAEVFAHLIIDVSKCAGKLSYSEDQALHLMFKGLWLAIFISFAQG